MSRVNELAKQAGVSVPTVYKVFDTAYDTSPEVQSRVLEAARALDYVHRPALRGTFCLQNVVAVVLDDVANPFYGQMLQAISKENHFLGYETMALYYDGSGERERKILTLLHSARVGGVMFLPSPLCDDGLVEQLTSLRFPLLQLFRPAYPQFDTVLIDDELGTFLAVQHLIERGHQKIMLISRTNPILIRREDGYARAFERAGLPLDRSFIFLLNYAGGKEMIREKIAELEPTAILSVGEPTSVDVMHALGGAGKRIPEDISLIVYDDLAWTSLFSITAVGHSFTELGRLSVELLARRMAGQEATKPAPPAKLTLNPRLISRGSVRSLTRDVRP